MSQMTKPPCTKVCGHRDCGISTGYVSEELTFGRGQLDDYGYWEIPCAACARAWERAHPGKECWPFKDAASCTT